MQMQIQLPPVTNSFTTNPTIDSPTEGLRLMGRYMNNISERSVYGDVEYVRQASKIWYGIKNRLQLENRMLLRGNSRIMRRVCLKYEYIISTNHHNMPSDMTKLMNQTALEIKKLDIDIENTLMELEMQNLVKSWRRWKMKWCL